MNLRSLSWTGPVTLAAMKPADPAEQVRTIELGLAGIERRFEMTKCRWSRERPSVCLAMPRRGQWVGTAIGTAMFDVLSDERAAVVVSADDALRHVGRSSACPSSRD